MSWQNSPRWFIDAWAVHDGRVFASRRPPDSIRAEATVFMSVPDLEAVPVGRISTALRATRSGFQDGLRDEDGNEIPFDALEQVRDLVRRAYLGAGLGPGAPGAVAAPLPRPEIGPGPGAAYLEVPADVVELFRDGSRIVGAFPAGLDEAVRRLALATLLEWDGSLHDEDPEEIRGLLGWVNALARSGVMADDEWFQHGELRALAHFAREHHASALNHALSLVVEQTRYWHSRYDNTVPLLGEMPGAYWSRLHLSVVPLPRAARWDPRLRRLAELHIQPLVDRRFWDHPRTMLDIAPLMLVQALRGAARFWRLPHEASAVEAAFSATLPMLRWVEQPDAAEQALAEFIDRCLSGPTTPRPSGRTHPSPHQPVGPGGRR